MPPQPPPLPRPSRLPCLLHLQHLLLPFLSSFPASGSRPRDVVGAVGAGVAGRVKSGASTHSSSCSLVPRRRRASPQQRRDLWRGRQRSCSRPRRGGVKGQASAGCSDDGSGGGGAPHHGRLSQERRHLHLLPLCQLWLPSSGEPKNPVGCSLHIAWEAGKRNQADLLP